jgi:hypothetical protein
VIVGRRRYAADELFFQHKLDAPLDPAILFACEIDLIFLDGLSGNPFAQAVAEFLAAGVPVADHFGDRDLGHIFNSAPQLSGYKSNSFNWLGEVDSGIGCFVAVSA